MDRVESLEFPAWQYAERAWEDLVPFAMAVRSAAWEDLAPPSPETKVQNYSACGLDIWMFIRRCCNL
jgi:hypothetical protein